MCVSRGPLGNGSTEERRASALGRSWSHLPTSDAASATSAPAAAPAVAPSHRRRVHAGTFARCARPLRTASAGERDLVALDLSTNNHSL